MTILSVVLIAAAIAEEPVSASQIVIAEQSEEALQSVRHVLIEDAACGFSSFPDEENPTEKYAALAVAIDGIVRDLSSRDASRIRMSANDFISRSEEFAQIRTQTHIPSILTRLVLERPASTWGSSQTRATRSAVDFLRDLRQLSYLLAEESQRISNLSREVPTAQRERNVIIETACATMETLLYFSGDYQSNDTSFSALQVSGGLIRSSSEIFAYAGVSHPWAGMALSALEEGADPVTAIRYAAAESALEKMDAGEQLTELDLSEVRRRILSLAWTAQSDGVSPRWRGEAALLAERLLKEQYREVREGIGGDASDLTAHPALFSISSESARVDLLSMAIGEASYCHMDAVGGATYPATDWALRPGGRTDDDGYLLGGDDETATMAAERLFSWSTNVTADRSQHSVEGLIGSLVDEIETRQRGDAVLCDIAHRMHVPNSIEAALASGERCFFRGEYNRSSHFAYMAVENAMTLDAGRPRTTWWAGIFGELVSSYMNPEVNPFEDEWLSSESGPGSGDDAASQYDEKHLQEWASEEGTSWYLGFGVPPFQEATRLDSILHSRPMSSVVAGVILGGPERLAAIASPRLGIERRYGRMTLQALTSVGFGKVDIEGETFAQSFANASLGGGYDFLSNSDTSDWGPYCSVGYEWRRTSRDGENVDGYAPFVGSGLQLRWFPRRRMGVEIIGLASARPLSDGTWSMAWGGGLSAVMPIDGRKQGE